MRCTSRMCTARRYRLFRQMGEQLAGVADPRERLMEGSSPTLRSVRESPALSSWFATAQRPIGGEFAEQSDVITALAAAFLSRWAPDDPPWSNAGRGGWCG